MKTTVKMIWAQGSNREIGIDNRLPWRLPEDLAHFKALTLNSIVVMGRKTYESIGRPLPGRTNVILTRDPEPTWVPEGVWVFNSVTSIINEAKGKTLYIIGGLEIYEAFMRFASELHVTHIDSTFNADTHAPWIDPAVWYEHESVLGQAAYNYRFTTYKKLEELI